MGTRSSGTKSGSSGQKRRPDLLVRYRLILSMIGYGYSAMDIRKALMKEWDISKQLLSEDFARMIRNRWITDLNPDVNKWKNYGLTESGRTVLAGYEKHELARLVKIENARHKCEIRNTVYLNKFLSVESYGFESNRKFKNSMMYHGRVNGLAVQVVIGKKPSMIITPRPLFVSTAKKGRIKVQHTVLDLVNELNNTWLFDLTPPVSVSGHGQIAIGGKFPKSVLEANRGGSMKIHKKYGIVSIDASPPDKIPHLELPFDVPEKVDEYLDVPDHMQKVIERMEKLEAREDARDYAIDRMAAAIEKNSDVSNKLYDLISGQVKTGQEQVRSLNSLSSNMFQ